MRWTFLGHAMWLVEVGGLRLLFDPLLGPTYHHGVFAPTPARQIDVAGLRPDVLIVTHRHPDHFDLDSLDQLARRFPEAVVLTADVLVGETCQRLGFRHVSLLEPWRHLALPGVDLLTTPSYCDVEEWGILLASPDGVAWNQVDTELRDQVPAVLARAAALLGRPSLRERLELGIVRWQPLLQVEVLLGRAAGFPVSRYGAELDRIAACRATALIPGAAGSQVALAEGQWLNAFAYPVSPARLQRDLARRCPEARVFSARPGARWTLQAGTVHAEPEDSPLVQVQADPDQRVFRPFVVPPLVDADPEQRGGAALRRVVDPWLRDTLAPALARHLAHSGGGVVVLEVVYPEGEDRWTLQVEASDRGGGGVQVVAGEVAEPDQRNAITGSALAAVIEGRAHWGRALLSGQLRSSGALYAVDASGLRPLRLPPFFLYLAIPYAEANARWVEAEVRRLLAQRDLPLAVPSGAGGGGRGGGGTGPG